MSRSPDEIRNYLRFQLAQLSEKNAQHEFERLCFDLAQSCVAPNLVPATGPVQAGGDQGRDFESYRQYIASTSLASLAGVSLQPTDFLVAGCTLNKQFFQKIRADLKTIFGGPGLTPTHVAYFCSYDVPVSRRHGIQAECKNKYSAHLDVFDANAIANLLASPDTFWIAEKYLSVPADFLPATTVLDTKYEGHKARWLTGSPRSPASYADFLEIKYGLRTATFEEFARPDIRRWLDKMSEFDALDVGARLRRKSRYEIAVANLRGLGDLDPASHLMDSYFDEMTAASAPAELEDAAILTTYAATAQRIGQFRTNPERITTWVERLAAAVNTALAETENPGDKCTLLSALTFVEMGASQRASEDYSDRVIAIWSEILDICRASPLYPVTRLADTLAAVVPHLRGNRSFLNLTREVDELVAARTGDHSAAERCLERAMTLLRANDFVGAITDLQTARIKWFTGETMENSIQSMFALCEAYSRLGLEFAARQYACAATYLCVQYEKETVRKLTALAASYYAGTLFWAGDGLTFMYAFADVLLLHGAFDAEPGNFTRYANMQDLWEFAAGYYALARRHYPDAAHLAEAAVRAWPIAEEAIADFLDLSENDGPLEKEASTERDGAEVIFSLFNDLGPKRVVKWGALGIEWEVEWDRTPTLEHNAEAICALLQVLQVEFSNEDLHLIPTKAKICVKEGDGASERVVEGSSNDHLGWTIELPKAARGRGGPDIEMVGSLLIAILMNCSVLTAEELRSLTNTAFDSGLLNRVFLARSPGALFAASFPSSLKLEQLTHLDPVRDENPILTHSQLRWNDSLSPHYSVEKAISMVTERYELIPPAIRISWPKLISNKETRAHLLDLREQGLPDWMILLTVANIVTNFQLGPLHFVNPMHMDEMKKRMYDRIMRPEAPEDPVFNPSQLDKETLQHQKDVMVVTLLSRWGMVCHQGTPDFGGIERLLKAKFRLYEDDVLHEDIFA